MSKIKSGILEILQKTSTTVIILNVLFVLSHVFFLQQHEFLSNDFFENYHYLIVLNMILMFITVALSNNKAVRIAYSIVLIFLLIFLIIFYFFVLWMTGLAKAFTHG
ncbi:hypothetical protein ACLB9Y_06395 [Chryseobacterium scophthalmum]|uniref:hypothetical protein n=1 Tax=Chryseobacterium scophthalmum TaxID=59733 RepID=UPI00398B4CE2